MKISLITFLFLLGFHAPALAFNCKDLYAAGYPDPRFPAGLECSLAKRVEVDGVQVTVYHYAKSFPHFPEDTGFGYRSLEVFADVYNALVLLNPELSTKLRFSGLNFIFTDHLPEDTEVAKVQIDHAQDGEACPIVVYASAFRKQTPGRQKQMLAHEIFHCIQDTMWREKVTGVPKNVRAWWSEGSAVWFSNLIYPSHNQEFDYNTSYDGSVSLVEQKEPYASHLFFQTLSQSWTGVQGVLDLIRYLPSSGTSTDQANVLLNQPSMELNFHKFAEEITSNRIKDFDGKHMATSMAGEPKQEKISEGERILNWTLDPLTIQITELEIPAQSIIYIENISESEKNPISFRGTTTGLWDLLYPKYPNSIDMSCKKSHKYVELLSSYAGKNDSGVPENFAVKVKAQKTPCQCFEAEKFDSCLYGDYEIDPTSIEAMFRRIFKGDYTVEKSSGKYDLSISGTQRFNFTQTNFMTSVVLHDAAHGDIRASVTLNGTTNAIGKHPAKNELCFSDLGDDYNIHIKIEFPQGAAESDQPYSQFEDLSSGGPLRYTCNAQELILLRPLPTGPEGETEYHPIRFKRVVH